MSNLLFGLRFLVLKKVTIELDDHQISHIARNDAENVLYSMYSVFFHFMFRYVDMHFRFRGPCVVMLVRRADAFETMASIIEHLDDLYYSIHPFTAMRDQHLFFRQGQCLDLSVFHSYHSYRTCIGAISFDSQAWLHPKNTRKRTRTSLCQGFCRHCKIWKGTTVNAVPP